MTSQTNNQPMTITPEQRQAIEHVKRHLRDKNTVRTCGVCMAHEALNSLPLDQAMSEMSSRIKKMVQQENPSLAGIFQELDTLITSHGDEAEALLNQLVTRACEVIEHFTSNPATHGVVTSLIYEELRERAMRRWVQAHGCPLDLMPTILSEMREEMASTRRGSE